MPTVAPVFGIDGSITIDGVELAYIENPTLSISRETETLSLNVAGESKAYYAGELDVGISFTMKSFKTESGTYPQDIAAVREAFITGGAVGVLVTDSSIGTISGDFIVTKMDETRSKKKVVSWAVELRPTFIGTPLSIGDGE